MKFLLSFLLSFFIFSATTAVAAPTYVVNVNVAPFYTEWAAYTPVFSAGFGTVTGIKFEWKRDGDSIWIRGFATCGTTAASALYISLPSTWTSDSTKNQAVRQEVGYGGRAGADNPFALATIPGTNNLAIGMGTARLGDVNGNVLFAAGNSFSVNAGPIPITGWTTPAVPVPILIGSVSSSTAGTEKIERAKIAGSATTPTITSQSGSWIASPVRNAIGDISFTMNGFASAPSCTYGSVRSAAQANCNTLTLTTTGIRVVCRNPTDAAGVDDSFDIICMGPR